MDVFRGGDSLGGPFKIAYIVNVPVDIYIGQPYREEMIAVAGLYVAYTVPPLLVMQRGGKGDSGCDRAGYPRRAACVEAQHNPHAGGGGN